MDIAIQSPSYFEKFFHTYSLKKSCFFFFIFVVILITALGTLTLMVIFVLKPQKPIFSLRAVSLDAYKLDVSSNSTLFVSLVVSLGLNAQNPNKIGIKYSRSRMHIFSEDTIIGQIRVPEFYQPSHSTNVSVPTRVLFHCVNISQILSGVSDVSSHTLAKVRILGDIRAHIQVFRITLPTVKIALECDISIDDRSLTLTNAAHSIKAVKTPLVSIKFTLLIFCLINL
ncbi:hypothetical protein DCAR_0518436 [Daucus carota subsp. sativus]|uniref:Late embryogenesis abundant protein LEA-2 subgroup domain-containing protein n=1 Tax=Daucus carota subsp. sativus TaxID=79200 RepID=A0AAF1AXG7_DAUCS|nr:hypothetical protein DCAR_0518436 [Daucus carota subsp. sativus]